MGQKLLKIGLLLLSMLTFIEASEPKGAPKVDQEREERSKKEGESPLLNFLLGELALQREDYQNAALYYGDLIEQSDQLFFLERSIGIDLARKRYKKALPRLERLVEREPESLEAWALLGETRAKLSDYKGAADAYWELFKLREATQGERSYIPLQMALADGEENIAFKEVLKELIIRDEQDITAKLLLANLYMESKSPDYEAAKRVLAEARSLTRVNDAAYTISAYLMIAEGEMKSALEILKEGAERELKGAFREYLQFLMRDLQFDEVRALIDEGLKENQEDRYLQIQSIFLDFELGQYEALPEKMALIAEQPLYYDLMLYGLFEQGERLDRPEKVAELIADLPVTDNERLYSEQLVLEASAALKLGNREQFLTIFERLRSEHPERREEFYIRQLFQLEQAERKEEYLALLTLIEPMLKQNLNSFGVSVLGFGALMEDDLPKMDQIYQEWLSENPNDAIILNAYGYTLLEADSERAKEALKYIERANEATPYQDYIEDSLGWAHFVLGNLEEAERYLTRAFNKNKHPEMLAHYLILQDALDNRAERDRVYKIFKTLHPNNRYLKALQQKYSWAK